MDINVSPNDDITKKIENFLEDKGIQIIIAFSGGSDPELPNVPSDDKLQNDFKTFSSKIEQRVISDAIKKFQNMRIAILTGGSKWGVPKTATQAAKDNGLVTIGVFPLTGKKYSLGPDLLDLSICVDPLFGESRWGDESSIFAKLLSGVIVYGGSAGTLVEISHILKMNEAIIKYGEKTPKLIVPLYSTGGVADGLPFIWAKQNVKRLSFPAKQISSGSDAADFLIGKLDMYDYLEI